MVRARNDSGEENANLCIATPNVIPRKELKQKVVHYIGPYGIIQKYTTVIQDTVCTDIALNEEVFHLCVSFIPLLISQTILIQAKAI